MILLTVGPTSQRHALVDRVHPRRQMQKSSAPRVVTSPDEHARGSVPAQAPHLADGTLGACPPGAAPGRGGGSDRPRGSVATLALVDPGEGPGSLTCARCGRPFTPRRLVHG